MTTDNSSSETAEYFYFSYKGKRSRQVTKEEWEKEWLDWWNQTASKSRGTNTE